MPDKRQITPSRSAACVHLPQLDELLVALAQEEKCCGGIAGSNRIFLRVRSMRLLPHQLFQVLVVFERLDLRIAEQAGVVALLNRLGDGGIAQDSLDLRV